jgi:hypothetical protein
VNGEWVWKSKWRESYSDLVGNLNLQIVLTIHYSPLTMKYTQSTLDKLEKIVEEAGYVVRYERGTFQSGYCILEQKKVVVLNKFLQTEGRINTLIDLIPQLDIQSGTISEESKKNTFRDQFETGNKREQ